MSHENEFVNWWLIFQSSVYESAKPCPWHQDVNEKEKIFNREMKTKKKFFLKFFTKKFFVSSTSFKADFGQLSMNHRCWFWFSWEENKLELRLHCERWRTNISFNKKKIFYVIYFLFQAMKLWVNVFYQRQSLSLKV